MALYALAQCTARLLLVHQQKQGHQRASISSRDNEEEGSREDWSMYCALADLGMEERVKGGWCILVCILRAFSGIDLLYYSTLMHFALLFALKVARHGA